MEVDPAIIAIFGPVPTGIELAESNVSVNNGAVIAMLCLCTLAVILRFVARVLLRNALMADDWAIIIALVSLLFLLTNFIYSLRSFFAKASIGATTGLSVAGEREQMPEV